MPAGVILAQKTMDAIERTIAADQGASFRGFLKQVLPHMDDAYRTEKEGFRAHLGASILGDKCGRAVWYSFRWVTKNSFGGRIMRLFNRGHLEEGRFIACLLAIGVQVFQQDANGKQYRVSFAEGHGGGSGDGVALGIPDLPAGTYALLEFKTHNDKSFADLKAKGVRESKPEHYVQMNVYMRKMGLAVALYGAVNKNNDELYFEIVMLNTELADQMIGRAEKIIWMQSAPTKLSTTPGWYECKFCDHRPVCHLNASPERTCRSCQHSTPALNKEWHCNHPSRIGKVLSRDEQAAACDLYTTMRDF